MLELREEVEEEYADKMDELRAMYRDEMNLQVSAITLSYVDFG